MPKRVAGIIIEGKSLAITADPGEITLLKGFPDSLHTFVVPNFPQRLVVEVAHHIVS